MGPSSKVEVKAPGQGEGRRPPGQKEWLVFGLLLAAVPLLFWLTGGFDRRTDLAVSVPECVSQWNHEPPVAALAVDRVQVSSVYLGADRIDSEACVVMWQTPGGRCAGMIIEMAVGVWGDVPCVPDAVVGNEVPVVAGSAHLVVPPELLGD